MTLLKMSLSTHLNIEVTLANFRLVFRNKSKSSLGPAKYSMKLKLCREIHHTIKSYQNKVPSHWALEIPFWGMSMTEATSPNMNLLYMVGNIISCWSNFLLRTGFNVGLFWTFRMSNHNYGIIDFRQDYFLSKYRLVIYHCKDNFMLINSSLAHMV